MATPSQPPPRYIADQGWSLLWLPQRALRSWDDYLQATWAGLRSSNTANGTDSAPQQKQAGFRWFPALSHRRTLLQRLLHDARYQNWAIVDAAGMGKTTTAEWLRYVLMQPEFSAVPVLVNADWFGHVAPEKSVHESLLAYLSERIIRQTAAAGTLNAADVRRGLERALKVGAIGRGQLVLIIDGLDHAHGNLAALTDLLGDPRWRNSRIVITGRPTAFELWRNELFPSDEHGKHERQFRVLRLEPFTPEQCRDYLQVAEEATSRYDQLSEDLRRVVRVPRMIKHLRKLAPARFLGLHTAADILSETLAQMLTEGLSVNPRAGITGKGNSSDEEWAWRLLATAAFVKTADQVPSSEDPTAKLPNFATIDRGKFDWFCREVWKRFAPALLEQGIQFTRDQMLERLGLLGVALDSNLLLQGRDRLSEKASDPLVAFVDKTWQEFLTAVYLGKYATSEDLKLVWDGWLPEWDLPSTQAYRDTWLYFCDLPWRQRNDDIWLETTALFYRPSFQIPSGEWSAKRSPEFIYRTWWRLHELLGEPYGKAMRPLDEIASEDPERLAQRAREIREAWWGEFATILRGDQEPDRQDVARQLVADFATIPAGEVWFGTTSESGRGNEKTHPANPLRVPEYQLARRPTTNAWLRLFVPMHGLRGPEIEGYERVSPTPEHPAIFVDWYLAWACTLYFQWKDGRCRLPSELEFERAAKYGMDPDAQRTWDYWWHATKLMKKHCYAVQDWNTGTSLPASPQRASAATKQLKQSTPRSGLMDLLGNVWEWQIDVYRNSYESRADEDALEQMNRSRALRGGSWGGTPDNCRLTWRDRVDPIYRDVFTGFRLAQD